MAIDKINCLKPAHYDSVHKDMDVPNEFVSNAEKSKLSPDSGLILQFFVSLLGVSR